MRNVLKVLIINTICTVLLASCHKDAEGPVVGIYKYRGDYADLVPVLISKDDTTKIVGLPSYDNIYIQKPIKFHKGYYAKGIFLFGTRTAYLSITWEKYGQFPSQPDNDTLEKLILDRHPFLEYWEDEGDVLHEPYNGFDTAKLNRIIDAGEMAKYFKRIK
jgi:hypothetical protein